MKFNHLFLISAVFFASFAFAAPVEKAQKGDVREQYNLGKFYLEGKSVAVDYSKSVHWFEKAAKQGDLKAQVALAKLYIDDEGMAVNYKKARALLITALCETHRRSNSFLELKIKKENLIPVHAVKAQKWFETC